MATKSKKKVSEAPKTTTGGKKKTSRKSTGKASKARKPLTYLKHPKLGKFFFDAVFSTQHNSTVTLTRHPVQDGASISDHAILEPDEVTLDIGMTDAMSDAAKNHSVNAFKTLDAMRQLRQPVKLVTRLKTYINMVITSMSEPDDFKTMNAMRSTIIFTAVDIVKVSTVKIEKKVSGSKGGGSKGGGPKNPDTKQVNAEPEKVENKSVAKQLADKVTGNP